MPRPGVVGDQQGGPAEVNRRAEAALTGTVPSYDFDGTYADYVGSEVELGTSPAPDDLGILPTPIPGG